MKKSDSLHHVQPYLQPGAEIKTNLEGMVDGGRKGGETEKGERERKRKRGGMERGRETQKGRDRERRREGGRHRKEGTGREGERGSGGGGGGGRQSMTVYI